MQPKRRKTHPTPRRKTVKPFMSSLEDGVCRLRTAVRPQWENRAHTRLPKMIMLKYVIRGGARPVGNQAGTAPGPEPQLGPPKQLESANGVKQGKGPLREQPNTSQSGDTASIVFAQWNAEGVFKKKLVLQNFLRDKKVDIICIQETHLTDALRFSIRGYQGFRLDRVGHKGGLLTLVRNNYSAVVTETADWEGTEQITVKIILPKSEILVVNCYCAPNKEMRLQLIPISENGSLILGDFNSHSTNWGYKSTDKRGEQLEDWMIENRLLLVNKPDDKPTHFHRAWKTTSHPDLAIATDNLHKICEKSVEDQLGGSDHRPVILRLETLDQPETLRKEASWNYKKADWKLFADLTDRYCRDADINEQNDINHNVTFFTFAILRAAHGSVPRGRRKNYKPFWSPELQELHSQLSTARNQMEKDPTPANISAHSLAREKYDEEKEKQQKTSWQEKTASLNMEKDTTKLWRLTKAINEDNQARHSTTVLTENNAHYTGKMAANILAENFKDNSLLDIPRDRAAEVRNQVKHAASIATASQLMTADFTIQELQDACGRLRTKKSPGKDGITNEMIKNLGNYAQQKLLDVFNQSWNTGNFPAKWKEAILIPILKKGKDKNRKDSYRPISLLSCLSKTMERMVNKRLQIHLERNGLISQAQSGFRKNRSTEDQVAFLAQEVENAFQEKMKTIAVFFDLTKAFDKVWKEGLLLKLLKKGIGGKMFKWLESYLFHRSARVKIDGCRSHLVKIKEGVPQGGVISPTLFIVFIDDIVNELSRRIAKALHADDLAIWTSQSHTSTATYLMQEAVDKVFKWSQEWLVEINKTKTESTCFSLSPEKWKETLKLDGQEIPKQATPTYLGVKMDKTLTWGPHIEDIEKKATKKLNIMRKLAGTNWGADKNILKQVYTSTVRPHLEYASTAWTTAAKSNTKKLDKVQNKGLRVITGGMKTTPLIEMEKTTGLQTLEERREERVFRQTEKMKRLSSHPLQDKLQQPTKNRLMRKSLNHISKSLKTRFPEILPLQTQEVEQLRDYEEWENCSLNIRQDIPGVCRKEDHTDGSLKALTMETLDQTYPAEEWAQIYTDGSAEEAIRNGGGGVYMKFPDGTRASHIVTTGKYSTNFRAEACALLKAAKELNTPETAPEKTVILSDCKSLLQSLQSCKDQSKLMGDLRKELAALNSRTQLVIQWIPSHCGVFGNEEADKLSKQGSKQTQTEHPVSYAEAKTLLKNCFYKSWKESRGVTTERDGLNNLTRKQQVTIFRLRTGHCRLLSHLYKLKISHTDECQCGTAPQTPEHLLQNCPLFGELRQATWPEGLEFKEKLWGPAETLRLTADFIARTQLDI